MQLGTITLPHTAALAPMAGLGDRAFREICKEFGACYLVGEMASAKGMTFGGNKTATLLHVGEQERPVAVQLFGDVPEILAEAAQLALEFRPDVIDINMGCPAPKIAGNGGGSALMKHPELAGRICRSVVDAVNLPVTVKFRKGWDDTQINAVEFARIMEANGAAAVTVHGRTRQQMYAPSVDLDIIAQVKQAVKIPVIGNGDVDSVDSAIAMYERTGCDLVMIGRGALGAPWVFRQIDDWFTKGIRTPDPSLEERMAIMLRHIQLACDYKGEYVAMRESRKHLASYLKGGRGAAAFRREASGVAHFADLEDLAQRVLEAQVVEE